MHLFVLCVPLLHHSPHFLFLYLPQLLILLCYDNLNLFFIFCFSYFSFSPFSYLHSLCSSSSTSSFLSFYFVFSSFSLTSMHCSSPFPSIIIFTTYTINSSRSKFLYTSLLLVISFHLHLPLIIDNYYYYYHYHLYHFMPDTAVGPSSFPLFPLPFIFHFLTPSPLITITTIFINIRQTQYWVPLLLHHPPFLTYFSLRYHYQILLLLLPSLPTYTIDKPAFFTRTSPTITIPFFIIIRRTQYCLSSTSTSFNYIRLLSNIAFIFINTNNTQYSSFHICIFNLLS